MFLLNFPHGYDLYTSGPQQKHMQKLSRWSPFSLKDGLTYFGVNQTLALFVTGYRWNWSQSSNLFL